MSCGGLSRAWLPDYRFLRSTLTGLENRHRLIHCIQQQDLMVSRFSQMQIEQICQRKQTCDERNQIKQLIPPPPGEPPRYSSHFLTTLPAVSVKSLFTVPRVNVRVAKATTTAQTVIAYLWYLFGIPALRSKIQIRTEIAKKLRMLFPSTQRNKIKEQDQC
jgi:hypothetical protein